MHFFPIDDYKIGACLIVNNFLLIFETVFIKLKAKIVLNKKRNMAALLIVQSFSQNSH